MRLISVQVKTLVILLFLSSIAKSEDDFVLLDASVFSNQETTAVKKVIPDDHNQQEKNKSSIDEIKQSVNTYGLIMLDGITVVYPTNSVVVTPTPEAVQEFQVVKDPTSANYRIEWSKDNYDEGFINTFEVRINGSDVRSIDYGFKLPLRLSVETSTLASFEVRANI